MSITLAVHSVAAHAQRPSRNDARNQARAAADARATLAVDGIQRTYVLRSPRSEATGTNRRPVVLVLHGGGGNALISERMTGFTPLVEREGILVVYPDGTGRSRTRLLTWNADHCCGPAMEREVNDVKFISMLIDTLIARHGADPTRIYVTGMSNGGMMTHRLGIALASRIAAIAPVVGTLFGDEVTPSHAVPAIIFNGMQDKSVPFYGGASGGIGRRSWDGTPAKPAAEQGRFWARTNGCDPTPEIETRGTIVHTRYRCPLGRDVELYAITDGGHAWPGGEAGTRRADTPSTSLKATEVMWAFFKAHARN